MGKAIPIKRKIQLLVEGKDQLHFFEKYIEHLSLTDVQIQNFGGVDELRDFLLGFANMPNFQNVQSVGIVRDAETSADGAFQSVRASLKNAGLSVPDSPEEPSGTSPMVTVLILPGENRPGMLETLLCESFANTSVNRCIDNFFTCVNDLRDVSITKEDKARARVYLTTKPQPHVSVGVAAQKGYWDFEHGVFAAVRNFLQMTATTSSPPTAS